MCVRKGLESLTLIDFQNSQTFFLEFQRLVNELKSAGAKLTEVEKLNYLLRTSPRSTYKNQELKKALKLHLVYRNVLIIIFRFFNQLKVSKNENQHLRNVINEEWSKLSSFKFSVEFNKSLHTAKNVNDFWFLLWDYTDENSKKLFKNLAELALTTFCSPNANATPERVWSRLNNVKTTKRNRLGFISIRGILFAHQYIHDLGGIDFFNVTPSMLEKRKLPFYKLYKEQLKKYQIEWKESLQLSPQSFFHSDTIATLPTECHQLGPYLGRTSNNQELVDSPRRQSSLLV